MESQKGSVESSVRLMEAIRAKLVVTPTALEGFRLVLPTMKFEFGV